MVMGQEETAAGAVLVETTTVLRVEEATMVAGLETTAPTDETVKV